MSILALTSNTLIATAAAGNIEYNGQFYGTDSAASRAQLQRITQGTAVASTSGTSITFSSIPSWVKRITMMLKGVGTSSTSNKLIQLGSGSPTITGYAASGTAIVGSVVGGAGYTTGFGIADTTAASRLSGSYVFTLENASTNTWCCNGISANASTTTFFSAGNVSLAGTLDRIIFTTVNGTDTMAAGEINILYEG